MEGLILNATDPQYNRWVDRQQTPCFYAPDNTGAEWPVFEVWFWHSKVKRWFCMATVQDQDQIRHGVVYFWPGDVDGLRRSIQMIGSVPQLPAKAG